MKEDLSFLEYNDVTIESMGTMVPVRLKLSEQGLTYKNVKTGKVEQLPSSDIEVINWQRLAGSYGVRIFTTNGTLYRFGGFKDAEQSKLEKFFKNTYSKTMTDKEFCVKGWNYGMAKFDGSCLSFEVSTIPAFEIPLNHVSGCVTGKNEVTMEFHQHDDAAISLMEMRFHIPPSELAADDPVENFRERVMAKASVITATGDALAIFREVQCLTPRGRYDIKVYPSFIQLHGKTFDFKIPITTVLRLFLLPHQDQRQHFFVVSLDPPIKQGQTRYPYLIMLFSNDDTDVVELPLTEEEIQEKYEGRMEKEITGPQYEVLSKIFKGLCNRKVVTPGNFTGHSGTPAIGCSYKAAAGYMYPLERGIIYVHKPPIHIRFDEIGSVNFARSGSTTRSFDFEIEMKNNTIQTFSSIEKGEYTKLFDYVNKKKLRIKNRGKMDQVSYKDDFGDSDADEPDHYMNRVRAEANERGDDNSDSEEDDEDFAPGEEGSDVAEEFDSNASDSSSDEDSEGGGGEKKEKKEKVKKERKAKTVSEKPRKRRPKKEKDENKPKRPQSAYFLWLAEVREQIKEENPGISITEITKKAGQMWKEVKDKSKWEAMAKEAKEEYDIAMKEYKAAGGGATAKKTRKTPQKSPAAAAAAAAASPTKAGSGGSYKSKEYISDSDSEESGGEKPKKKVKREPKEEGKEKVKKEPEDDEEEEAASTPDESSEGESGSE